VAAQEASGHGHEVEVLGLAEALGQRAARAAGPPRREVGRGDARRATGGHAHDGFARLHRAVDEVDRAVRMERGLERVLVDLAAAGYGVPREHRAVREELGGDAAAPRRVKVGEERRDAGRAREELRETGRSRRVGPEGEAAVRVHEHAPVDAAEEGEREGEVDAPAVVGAEAEG
jgi:hypothetical protein